MMTDGKGQKCVYDGWGRLREARLTAESDRIKAAYRYNGVGMRITHAINASTGTTDNDVTDAGDPANFFADDERWRVAATYASSANASPASATPAERYVLK